MLKLNHYDRGRIAEFLVILYLLFYKFYWPVHWRYKTSCGEIDIIAKHIFLKRIVFVEVKERMSCNSELFESITLKQWSRIHDASGIFLIRNNNYLKYNLSFDAAFMHGFLLKKYFANAWQIDRTI